MTFLQFVAPQSKHLQIKNLPDQESVPTTDRLKQCKETYQLYGLADMKPGRHPLLARVQGIVGYCRLLALVRWLELQTNHIGRSGMTNVRLLTTSILLLRISIKPVTSNPGVSWCACHDVLSIFDLVCHNHTNSHPSLCETVHVFPECLNIQTSKKHNNSPCSQAP